MKRIISVLLVVCVFFSIATSAFADNYVESENPEGVVISDGETRAEETQWVFRCWNGLLQARLWSITYGYWLTEWETIGTC